LKELNGYKEKGDRMKALRRVVYEVGEMGNIISA
jgi:hypothetical protein